MIVKFIGVFLLHFAWQSQTRKLNVMFSIPCMHPKWKIWIEGNQYYPVTQQPKALFAKI